MDVYKYIYDFLEKEGPNGHTFSFPESQDTALKPSTQTTLRLNMISLIVISTSRFLNLYLFKARMRLDWWPSGSASCLLAPTARVSQEFQVKIPLTPNLTEQP